MKCPVCNNVDLLLADRHGVEIDYCPNCRGVWLDRGEIDKIIEREESASGRHQREQPRHVPAPQAQHAQGYDPNYRPEQHDRYSEQREHYDDRGRHGSGHGKHRKKSFFGELFDFD
jgi:uncharacterized protein